MLVISQSVGAGEPNQYQDVRAIQSALNKVKWKVYTQQLKEDGLYGKKTASAITRFQNNFVNMIKPDGRIDPSGKTIRKLRVMQKKDTKILFPLTFIPSKSYKAGVPAFGSNRSKGRRKHAACDLYAKKGTPIRAIKDGKVIQHYPFYYGTDALEVDHGDLVVRYGEILRVANGVSAGSVVKRGQVIAYVGEMVFPSGKRMSMLHIEFYKGTSNGPLTQRSNYPYQRRSDLLDPTPYLDNAQVGNVLF